MEPRFELTALRTKDRPGLEIVWATPGVSRAILPTFSITSTVRSIAAESGN